MQKSSHSSPDRTEGIQGLFEQYRDRLQRFLSDRSARGHAAPDLAQEVYLRLLRFPAHELVREPQAYLFRIATNVVNDFNVRVRKDRVVFDSARVDELADSVANHWMDDPADQLGTEQQLATLLENLPTAHRAALILAKRDGLSYEAIAAELGVSVHAVKKYVVRAMAHCRAGLLEGQRT